MASNVPTTAIAPGATNTQDGNRIAGQVFTTVQPVFSYYGAGGQAFYQVWNVGEQKAGGNVVNPQRGQYLGTVALPGATWLNWLPAQKFAAQTNQQMRDSMKAAQDAAAEAVRKRKAKQQATLAGWLKKWLNW